MQVQRTFKRREGVWGIVKGDKGGASQVAPLSPLTKYTKNGIAKRCFASLNMTRDSNCHCEAIAEAINRAERSETFDCFASLAMTHPLPPPQGRGEWRLDLVALLLSLRASTTCERGNQQARNPHDSSFVYG